MFVFTVYKPLDLLSKYIIDLSFIFKKDVGRSFAVVGCKVRLHSNVLKIKISTFNINNKWAHKC